ncbi:hypothetical protein ZWY2020_000957 [Hordeum vulgare]|nr:hypothetical protein ZWY2020_000957 [Hordeum vulgare]
MELVTPQPADVFFNGCLHLHAYGRWSSCCSALVDTKGETWASLGIPGHLYGGFIQLSQGRLHGANFEKDRHDDVVRLVVYVLEEYDNNAWILKHSVETPYLLGGANVVDSDRFAIHPVDCRWIAIHPECKLIFFTVGSACTLMCYDMDRRKVKVVCNLDGYQPRLPYVPLYSDLQSLHR